MKRHGYFVEGKHFRGNLNQAAAFAQFRATEFGRPVVLTLVGYDGVEAAIETFQPKQQQVA